MYDLYFKSFKGETPPVFSILGTPQLRPTGPARSYRCCSGLGSQQNLGVETVFRPRKRMRSFFLLKWGVQILLCLFCQNQTPRSDSANLEPPDPFIFFTPKFWSPGSGTLRTTSHTAASRRRSSSGSRRPVKPQEFCFRAPVCCGAPS